MVRIGGTVSATETSQSIEGALVALIPEAGLEAQALSQTDHEGGFSFCVPPGTYALTTTSSTFGALYEKPRLYDVDSIVALKLERSGKLLEGKARLPGKTGETYLRLLRTSYDVADAFYIPVQQNGSFRAFLPDRFNYVADLRGGYRSVPVRVLSDSDAQPLELVGFSAIEVESEPPLKVIDWLRSQAIPVRTTNPTGDLSDLEPLRSFVENVTVVGIGENSHGSRENFQFKHRVFRFLVENLNFSVFLMESGFAETAELNAYINGSGGDLRKMLPTLGYWTWDCREFLDLIEWMREFNADPKRAKKISVYGVDMQISQGALAYVLAYLTRVKEPDVAAIAKTLAPLSTADPTTFYSLGQAEKARTKEAAHLLIAMFDERRSRYAKDEAEDRRWRLARQYAVVLAQAVDMYTSGLAFADVRDRSMATNVMWVLEYEGIDARAMLWAHNGHVELSPDTPEFPLGAHLRSHLGKRYLAVAQLYRRGTVRAWDTAVADPNDASVTPVMIEGVPAGYYEHAFGMVGKRDFILDLRTLASSNLPWLQTPHSMLTIGAEFNNASGSTVVVNLPSLFDLVFYTDVVSATLPNPAALRGAKSR